MTLIEVRFKSLSGDLSSAIAKLKGDVSPKAVHRLRTSIRRMESLLHYLDLKFTRKQSQALADLAKLRKRAGRVRDLDTGIALLEQGIGNGSAAADRRTLLKSIGARRERQAARLAVAARRVERSKLFTYLDRLLLQAKRQPGSTGLASIPLLRARGELSAIAARYPGDAALKPRKLHALRTRLKLIRYQAELAEPSPEQTELLRLLKSVHHVLGEWHDWQLLCHAADKQFSDRANCPLLVEARALSASRYLESSSAVNRLLQSLTPVRKHPRTVGPPAAFRQHA